MAGQLALTAILLVGAALVGKSLARLSAEDPGFEPEQVLATTVWLAGPAYQTPAAQQRFFEQLLDRVRVLPGVGAVGAVTNLPTRGGGTLTYRVEGLPEPDPAARPSVLQRRVAGEYFRALGIPLVAGRTFGARDDSSGTPAIVINRSLARRLFSDASAALGRRFRFYAFPDVPWEIIGVVGDVKTGSLDAAPPPTVYYSHLQFADNELTLAIRSATHPEALAPGVRAIVRFMDPSLPVSVSTLNQVLARSFPAQSRRYSLFLIGAFGATALLLAVVGVYGVIAFSVAQRARELGIRAALGATRSQLLGLVMRKGSLLAGAGVAAGCVLALGSARFLGALLYQVKPTDPPAYLGVALLLGAIALLASAIPARRAAHADPAAILRSD